MDFAHSLILKKMDEEYERITNLCREERELERRLARESKKKIESILYEMKDTLKENTETINKYKIPHELI